ncbi:MAG: peptide ABC transporter substrate-binding protein [Halobacteriovoraceae bacterium]|nr:peptide ABC transporter substrate-binding protein [Halobacteriovoraceae bacterium]
MLKFFLFFIIFINMISCRHVPKENSVFYRNLGNEPSVLNPIGSTDAAATSVHDLIYETLLVRDLDTYEWKPSLATEWKLSSDKMKYTFKLRKGVKWHDGKDFTAKDVKFSFDIIFKDKFNTAAIRPYFTGLKEVKIIDDYTVEIIAKDKNWQNFNTAAELSVYPKHFYEQDKKKSFFNKNLIGSGPYIFDLYTRGSRILLRKNPLWWGDTLINQPKWKFPKVVLRFSTDRNVSLEMLKKGSLDFMGLTAAEFLKKTNGEQWGKSVHKVKTFNNSPKGYNFIGWNLKHPILKDRKVRKALSHLVNRKLMIEKFEYGYSVPAKGPIYPGSAYTDKSIKEPLYSTKIALKILRSAGWSDTDGDNILDKIIDGKKTKLSITIMEPAAGFMKYLTVFKEDAKKAGVEINIKLIEWNSFVKLLEERKFDACRLAWSAAVDWNPIQIWHSDSMKGGSNFVSFSNKEADRLMTAAKYIHNKEERIKMLRKVERLIVEDYPYVWFSYKASTMYGYNNRIKRDKDTLNYSIGTSYWSFKSKMREEI